MDNFLASFLDALQLAENFDEKMEKALECLVVQNGFDSGHLLLFEPIGRRIYHFSTQAPGARQYLKNLQAGSEEFEKIRLACAHLRKSVTIEEYGWEDSVPDMQPPHGSLEGIEANSVLLPLWSGEGLIAVIKLVGQPGGLPPDRERRAFLDLVGRQMGKELAREAVLLREEALVRERQVLLDIGKAIISGLDRDEICGHIVRVSMEQTGVGHCAIHVLDEEGLMYTVMGSETDSEAITAARNARLDPYFIGDVMRTILDEKTSVYIEDARTDPRTNNEFAKAINLVSALGVPLLSHDKAMGFIILYEDGRFHRFGEEDIRIVEGIAAFAAVAIENAHLYRESQEQEVRLADLMLRLAHTREEERSRISRELHDSMAQTLLEIIYKAENMLGSGPGESLEGELKGMLKSSRSSLTELRRIITDLRPASVEVLGLAQALHNLLERFAVTCQIKVEAEIDLDPGFRLDSLYENSLYRMVQETLNNIARHAGASRVDFLLRSEEGFLDLRMSDDGPGVDLSSPLSEDLKQGLVILREKSEIMGGTLEISIEPGKGGTLSLRVPLPSNQAIP